MGDWSRCSFEKCSFGTCWTFGESN